MKFLAWLFNVTNRHRGGIRRYERGGALIRLITLVLMLALCAATIGVEWWATGLWTTNFIAGVLAFILAVILCIATAEFCFIYALTAIRMFLWGVAERAAHNADVRRARRAAETDKTADADDPFAAETGAEEPAPQAQQEPAAPPKTHRAFDMFIFVAGLICAVGIFVALIACAVTWL